MTGKIKPIHNFGPPVGKWTVHPTVAETLARERKRLKDQTSQPQKVVGIRKVAK